MQVFIYNFLRRFLSQQKRNSLKRILFKTKKRLKKYFLLHYGTINNDELLKHIQERVGKNYDILMIHSSFDNMQPMYIDNINIFVKKLVEYCLENEITLVMPAFFFGKEGNDIIDAANYYRQRPFIDLRKTHSQMGLISEIFRRFPGVKRSVHPTHSVCSIGVLADIVTGTHHLSDNPYGELTPFGIMTQYKTKILGIGTKYYRVLTQVHTAEELMREKFPIKFNYNESILIKCITNEGKEIIYPFAVRSKEYRIDAIALKKILKNINIQIWKFKGISFFTADAKLVTDALIKAAEKGQTIYRKIEKQIIKN